MTFDGVPPDKPVIATVPAPVLHYVQSVTPLVMHVLAFVVYVLIMLCASRVHPRAVNVTLVVVMLCVLMASLFRRIAPFILMDVGHYRYERVSSTVTRLLPSTCQSWIAVQTLAVVAIGHPLYLLLFTHYTAKGNLYAFAMLGLPGTLGGPLIAFCIGILICVGLLGILYGAVLLPAKGYNPFHVRAPEDRVSRWIRLSSWFPLTVLLMVLFCAGRLLPCDGTHASYTATSPPYTCGSSTHWFAGIVAWLFIAASFVGLDIGIGFLRLLGGQEVPYYALEPRLDGLFCELLVWALKVSTLGTMLLASVALHGITALLFLGLFAFAWRRRTATAEALEEIIRCVMAVVVATSVMSCFMSICSIPAVVQGLLILLAWLLSVAGAVALYQRRFGWVVFGSGDGVTADLIVV